MQTCSDCGKHASHEVAVPNKENINVVLPPDWCCNSCVVRQATSSTDGKIELAHLQTALGISHKAQVLALKIGLDRSSFDINRYPKGHVFHGYSGYALTSAMVAMVRYGADSNDNFRLLFGTTPENSESLSRVYGDALASTPRFPFAGNMSVLTPERTKTQQATSPTHPQALWCDDAPYQCGENRQAAPYTATKQKQNKQVRVLLPAVYNMCGRHYIKSRPKCKPKLIDSHKDQQPREPIKAKIVRRVFAETQNLPWQKRKFPPLPKHLTRGTDQNYSPSSDAAFSIAVSSVTGAIYTGAVADTQPVPKMMPDGAHDRDDGFITCVF